MRSKKEMKERFESILDTVLMDEYLDRDDILAGVYELRTLKWAMKKKERVKKEDNKNSNLQSYGLKNPMEK